jgi:hypothetical protein
VLPPGVDAAGFVQRWVFFSAYWLLLTCSLQFDKDRGGATLHFRGDWLTGIAAVVMLAASTREIEAEEYYFVS